MDRGQTYTLRRLARDNPALLDKVEAGELTANAAAIEAGFRKPTKSIPVDSAESAVRALLRVFQVLARSRAGAGLISAGIFPRPAPYSRHGQAKPERRRPKTPPRGLGETHRADTARVGHVAAGAS